MRFLVIATLVCLPFVLLSKNRKKRLVPRMPQNGVEIIQASKTFVKGGVRNIGQVYTFTVKIIAPNIKIDSVQFGHYIMPCDVFQSKTRNVPEQLVVNELYDIQANENLYAYHLMPLDSSISYVTQINTDLPIIYYMQNKIRKKLVITEKILINKTKGTRDRE